jgi:hypothetical protein
MHGCCLAHTLTSHAWHCSGDACPYVPGVEVVAWQVPDPHGAALEAVREIRDYLKGQVRCALLSVCWLNGSWRGAPQYTTLLTALMCWCALWLQVLELAQQRGYKLREA